MKENLPFLNIIFFNNSIKEYLISLVLIVILFFVFKILKSSLIKKIEALSKKTKIEIDDLIIRVIKNINGRFYLFLSFFLATRNLELGSFINKIIYLVLTAWITILAIKLAQEIVNYFFQKKINKESGNTSQALKTINFITRIILWLLGVLFMLSNMGININSAIAGLGIGGVTIALALQNILSDLFSSFAIYFDKPFEVGDFISSGQHSGVVKKIGIKTTRLEALQGEEIVIANQELTKNRIQNFKKLEKRRVVAHFGVTYDTNNQKLEKIKGIVADFFKKIEKVEFSRCHFAKFQDSSLEFELVYYVNSSDYNIYMDVQEKINLALKKGLEKEKIEMAFPTQTIYLNKD